MKRQMNFFSAMFTVGVLLMLSGGMTSCTKEGCTDQSAINYDEDAENDDGSCIYGDDQNTPESQELSGTEDTPTTLTNVYDDPSRVDYVVTGRWTLDAGVTIDPGVRISVEAGERIRINSSGYLSAEGTSDAPIYIEGEEHVKGYWEYIRFSGSNNPNNLLSHTHISDAGSDSYRNGAVVLSGSSRLNIKNTSITNSERHGLLCSSDATLDEFENNHFDECGLNPIALATFSQAASIDMNTVFVGDNTYNAVYLSGNNVDQAVTLGEINGPYYLEGTSRISGGLEFEPGVRVLMGPEAEIRVNDDGYFKAEGTESNRITIEGDEEVEGYWDYIRFNNSKSPDNIFRYVDVNYGGGDSYRDAAIYLSGDAHFKMGNSSVNYSARDGVGGSSSATFTDEGGNTYTGNSGEDNTYL